MAPVNIRWVVELPKITHYLLNTAHPDGASKARYFMRFGYRVDQPEILGRALVSHGSGNPPGRVVDASKGPPRIVFEGPVQAVDGRTMNLRTVWEVDPPDGVRFITAIPLTR